MMPGMPASWAPAGPQPRRLTWGRARARQRPQKEQPKKSSPQASPETTKNRKQQHLLWLGSRARARRPENQREKSKGRAAREPATAKAKQTAQQFLTVFTAFCRARAHHRRHARQRLAPKCAKMSLAYIPPILHGLRGFLEGSLDDADQAPLKHPRPTRDPDDVSRCFARVSNRQAKPQARASDAEVPDLGSASRPSGEGRRQPLSQS